MPLRARIPMSADEYRPLVERAAELFGIRVADVFAPNRIEDANHARFALALVLRDRGLHYRDIGAVICRDRATVDNAVSRAERLVERSKRFAIRVLALASGSAVVSEASPQRILEVVAEVAGVSPTALVTGQPCPSKTPAVAAVVLLGSEHEVTTYAMARLLNRDRYTVQRYKRKHAGCPTVQTLLAVSRERLQAELQAARDESSATEELAA